MLRTIRARVDHQAEQRPDATYLVAPETGLVDELRRTARGLAASGLWYLQGEGIRPGARVALLMHNGYQTCRLFIGAMYGGYCVTPLNLLAQPTQLAYVLEHSDAEIVFVAPDQVERLQQAASGMARPPRMVVCDVDAAEFLPPVEGGRWPVRRCPGRGRCGADDVHLGHHRQAQGRGAGAARGGLGRAIRFLGA
jgi:long-chain acyl-CoA synthetase